MITPSSTLARISHTILPLALGLSLAACTPAQLATGVVVGRAVVHYTCAGARKLCELSSPEAGSRGEDACRFFADACAVVGEGAGGEEPAPAPVLEP